MSVSTPITSLPGGAAYERRMSRAIHARRGLPSPQGRGRAWINGREVGGRDPRYAHLSSSHD